MLTSKDWFRRLRSGLPPQRRDGLTPHRGTFTFRVHPEIVGDADASWPRAQGASPIAKTAPASPRGEGPQPAANTVEAEDTGFSLAAPGISWMGGHPVPTVPAGMSALARDTFTPTRPKQSSELFLAALSSCSASSPPSSRNAPMS
jgi:hypothetical protein